MTALTETGQLHTRTKTLGTVSTGLEKMGVLFLEKACWSQIIGNSTAQTQFFVFSPLEPSRLILDLTAVAPALTRRVATRKIQMLTYSVLFHSVYMYYEGLRHKTSALAYLSVFR